MHIKIQKKSGFTLVEILIVVGIMGVLLAIVLPNFLKNRMHAQKQICIENLAQIDSAKQIFGLENGKVDGDAVGDDDLFGIFAYMKKKPECPVGGQYEVKPIATFPTCTVAGHEL